MKKILVAFMFIMLVPAVSFAGWGFGFGIGGSRPYYAPPPVRYCPPPPVYCPPPVYHPYYYHPYNPYYHPYYHPQNTWFGFHFGGR